MQTLKAWPFLKKKEPQTKLKNYKYQHHRPCGFMINVVNNIDSSAEFLYRGEDCIDVFVKRIIDAKRQDNEQAEREQRDNHDL